MTISVNWSTKEITVPQADLTLISGNLYELDVNAFRLSLRDLEDDTAGMVFPTTHSHNTEIVLSGVTYSRFFQIINGYTITFEDGSYRVNLIGANNNIPDVANLNSVSIQSNNSAGLVTINSASVGAAEVWNYLIDSTSAAERLTSTSDSTDTIIDLLTNNAVVTNEANGSRTVTIYEDDGTTIKSQVNISADNLTRTRIV